MPKEDFSNKMSSVVKAAIFYSDDEMDGNILYPVGTTKEKDFLYSTTK
jgi:hypothetical protein